MKVPLFREQIDRWFGAGSAVRPEVPGDSLLRQDPLQVDSYTRTLRSPHELLLVAKDPPLREYFGSPHPHGYYLYSLGLPDNLFGEEQIQELSKWIRGLNFYLKKPVTSFTWNQPDCAHYRADSHRVLLRPEWHLEPSRRTETAKAALSHEMMHGIFHSMGFAEDADWRSIYHLSLGRKNYEIFDDSNYLAGRPDYYGHPYDNASEAFASAGTAYYFKADLFAAYIRNPQTPEAMRLTGKAAWCFLRDRVFDGEVFTADGIDPFSAEDTSRRLAEAEAMESESLWSAYLSSDFNAREPARRSLAALLYSQDPIPSNPSLSDASREPSLAAFEAELPHLLLDLFEGGEGEAREAALHRLLQEHYSEISAELLESCLEMAQREDKPEARKLAIQALAAIRDKETVETGNRIAFALAEALDDPEAEVRFVAEIELRTRTWLELQPGVDRALASLPPQPWGEGLAVLWASLL